MILEVTSPKRVTSKVDTEYCLNISHVVDIYIDVVTDVTDTSSEKKII